MRVFPRDALLVLIRSLLLAVTACEGDNIPSNPYDLTAEIQRPPPPERSIVETNVEEVSTLSEGDDYTLSTPHALALGSDGHAHPTLDYGSVHGSTTLRGDLLTVQRRGTDRLEFDLYDAERLRYRHIVQFPLDPGTAEYDGHRLAVARDTSVVLYRLSPRD